MKNLLKKYTFSNFRFRLSHISFSLWYSIIAYIIYNIINFDKIAQWFYIKNEFDYVGLTAFFLVGLCLSIAVFILFAHRWTIKPFAIFFTILSGMSTYFIAKYDVAIDLSMLENVLNTDAVEVRGLLSFQITLP